VNFTGLAMALVATVAYNVGFVLEKRALARLPTINARRPHHLLRVLFTSPAWLAGFVFILGGLGAQVAVLSVLPITVAQPLRACGIGVLMLLAWFTLGERAGRREWWRLGIVVVSVVLITLSSTDGGVSNRQAASLTMGVTVVASMTVAVALYVVARRDPTGRHHRPPTGIATGITAGLLYGIAGLGLKGLASQTAHHTFAEVLHSVPRSPYTYLVLIASAGGMAMFQTGLQRFRASVVVPVANIMSNGYFLLIGSVLFHENLPSAPLPLALRATGLAANALALLIQPEAAPSPAPGTVPRPRHLINAADQG
jgi:drug/metabolite transporter (DMT)-like permease